MFPEAAAEADGWLADAEVEAASVAAAVAVTVTVTTVSQSEDAVAEAAADAEVATRTWEAVEVASESSEPEVPKGKVFAWEPFVTDFWVAGSKKRLGSLAGSCAWTRPFSCEFFGAFWQKTELRLVAGFVVKSYYETYQRRPNVR